jgi:glycosyltransferase involved in cell wall biosynthesis
MTPPDVSVVVPLYRTATTVPELGRRVAASLAGAGLTHELVLVDDACPAGSGEAAEALALEDPRVVALLLPENGGQHAAVLTGLAAARGAWAAVLDGDLQDPPEAIPLLVAAGRDAGVPVVFAGRRGRYQSRARLLTSRLYKRTLSLLAGVPPDAGIFVVLERPAVDRLLAMRTRRRPSLVAMIGCTGLPMLSVPVERAPRPEGESSYSPLGRLRMGWRAVAWVVSWKVGRRLGGREEVAGGRADA